MIKNILVAHDGSAYGKAAVEYAVWLAKGLGASVTGLYVVDIVALEGPFLHDMSASIGFEPFLDFSSKMRGALEEKGASIMALAKERCAEAGVPFEGRVTTGIITNEICGKAKLNDLVIAGRRGINERFEYGLLGSTTEALIRRSPKPALMVPKAFKPPSNPLAAFDGSPNAGKALHSAAELVKALGLPLTVATVTGRAKDAGTLSEAMDYLKPYGIRAVPVELSGEPPYAIEKRCKDNGHDMIFMGVSHRLRLVEMVLGSTTEHVMRAVDVPLFIER